jgi:hypothetical protein
MIEKEKGGTMEKNKIMMSVKRACGHYEIVKVTEGRGEENMAKYANKYLCRKCAN